MPVPTNTTPATATVINALPYTKPVVAADVDLAPTGSGYDSTCDSTQYKALWWTYTTKPTERVIAVTAQPSVHNTTTYLPRISIWSGPVGALAQYILDNGHGAVQEFCEAPDALWLEVPVQPSTTYYFQITASDNSTPDCDLIVQAEGVTQAAVPAGSIIIPDDTDGFPAVVISAVDGTFLGLRACPACEVGAVIQTGEMCLQNGNADTGVAILDRALAVVATHDYAPKTVSHIMADGDQTFYVLCAEGTTYTLHTITKAGVVGGTVWTMPSTATLGAITSDGSTLYFGNHSGPSDIHAYDLVHSTSLPDLAAAVASHHLIFGGQWVNADGSICFSYQKADGTDGLTLRYSAAGTLLQTYAIGDDVDHVNAAPGASTFWVWTEPTTFPASLHYVFTQYRLSDGAQLVSFQVPSMGTSGEPDPQGAKFGVSKSCPLIVMPVALDAQIVVQKITVPKADPNGFSFTAGGGLSPGSFTLHDGDVQVFTPVTPGSGYSIAEAPLIGWTTAIVVSNASPASDITVAAGEIVTVTVTNTKGPIVGPSTPTPTPTPSGPCDCPPPGGSGPGSDPTTTPGNPGWNLGGHGWVSHCSSTGGVPSSYPTVTVAEDFTGVRELRTWIDARLKTFPDGTVTPLELALGKDPIPDPPSYQDGYKRGLVKTIAPITRSLSTEDGEVVGTRGSADLDDRQRDFRTLLDALSTKRVHGREVNIKTISETRRLARGTPSTLFRGIARGHGLLSRLQATIEFEDRLTSEYGPLGSKRTITDRKLTKGLFAGIPKENIGRQQPIILGQVGDWGATDPQSGAAAERGMIPVLAVGNRSINGSDYTEVFVAGHAMAGFDVYGQDVDDPTRRTKVSESEYGSNILAPGHAGWPFATSYFDYADADTGKVHRVSTFFAKGPMADAHNLRQITFAVNGCGLEETGDGTGRVVDQFFCALQMLIDNFIFRSYYTGNYLGAPQWEDGVYLTNSDSFAAAQALSTRWIGDAGYLMGLVINDLPLSRDVLKRCFQTVHCRGGWSWAGQYGVALPDDTVDVSTTPQLYPPFDIRAGITPTYSIDQLTNVIRFNYDYDYDAQQWRGEQEAVRASQAPIDQMGGERELEIDCWASRDIRTVKDAMARTLLWRKYEQEIVQIAMPVHGLNYDIGQIVRASSVEGVGDGYDGAPFLLTDVEYDPKTHRNVFTALAMSSDIVKPRPTFEASGPTLLQFRLATDPAVVEFR